MSEGVRVRESLMVVSKVLKLKIENSNDQELIQSNPKSSLQYH